jgi:spermidine synthase
MIKKYGRSLIFSGQDIDNVVEVVEDENIRALHFGTPGQQSEMSLQAPYALVSDYTRLMALSLLFQPKPKSILMLGLGGGTLPKFLWKAFPQCHIDLVERSALIVDVCHQYFGLPQSPFLHTHVIDALDFVHNTETRYDLLFIDLFDGTGVPKWLGETPFLGVCRNRLKDKNSLLVWNLSAQTPESLMTQCLHQIAAAFGPHTLILPTRCGANYVFLGFPREREPLAPWEMARRASELQELTGFPFSQSWEEVQTIVS